MSKRKDGRYAGTYQKDGKRFFAYSKISQEDANQKAKEKSEGCLSSEVTPISKRQAEPREVETIHDLAITFYYPTIKNLNRRTREGYWRDSYLLFIKPVIGHRRFSEVRKIDIVNLINSIKQGYAVKAKCLIVIRAIIRESVDNGVPLNINLDRVTAGKKPQKKELKLSPEIFQEKLEVCPPHMVLPIVLGGVLGARAGEIMGLKWSDIDRKRSIITIQRQRTKFGTYGLPKGEKIRKFKVVPEFIEFLESHKVEGSEFVCIYPHSRVKDSAWTHSSLGREWKKLGFEFRVGLHQLRHLAATLMANHQSIAAMAILGHSQLGTTNKYIHSEVIDTSETNREALRILKSVVKKEI